MAYDAGELSENSPQVDVGQRVAAFPVVGVVQLAAERSVSPDADFPLVVLVAESRVEVGRRHQLVAQLTLVAAAAFRAESIAGQGGVGPNLHPIAAHHGQGPGVIEHGRVVEGKPHAHTAHADVFLPAQVHLKAAGGRS
jgi:hypothetical protein